MPNRIDQVKARLLLENNDPLTIARLHNELGLLLAGEGKWSESLSAYSEARDLYEKYEGDTKSLRQTLLNIATALSNLGRLEESAKLFLTALSQVSPENVQDKLDWAQAHNDLGVVYIKLHDWHSAHTALEVSAKYYKEIDYKEGLAKVYQNLSILLINMGNFSEAIETLNEAYLLYKIQNNRLGLAEVLGNFGLINKRLGKLELALEDFQSAAAIFEQLDYPHDLARTIGNIAAIHQEVGNVEEAIRLHSQAYELFVQVGDEYSAGMVAANLGQTWKNKDIHRSNNYFRAAITKLQNAGAETEARQVMGWLLNNLT